MTELKPCPFCGKPVDYSYDLNLGPNGIMCLNCRIVVRYMRISVKGKEKFEVAMDKMAESWNRRARNDQATGDSDS